MRIIYCKLSGILQQNLGLIPHEIQLKKNESGGAIQENWLVNLKILH